MLADDSCLSYFFDARDFTKLKFSWLFFLRPRAYFLSLSIRMPTESADKKSVPLSPRALFRPGRGQGEGDNDREQHAEVARAGTFGAAGADELQVYRPKRRTDQKINDGKNGKFHALRGVQPPDRGGGGGWDRQVCTVHRGLPRQYAGTFCLGGGHAGNDGNRPAEGHRLQGKGYVVSGPTGQSTRTRTQIIARFYHYHRGGCCSL